MSFVGALGSPACARVNEILLAPLMETLPVGLPTIALMDATDLPASDRGFKKNRPDGTVPLTQPWVDERSRPARAAVLSGTRNTRFGSGCRRTQKGYYWCHWSAGWRQLTLGKADY